MTTFITKGDIRIVFNPMNIVTNVERGTLLLEAARKAGIPIRSVCGSQGECGTCKVIITKGETRAVSSKNEKWFSEEERNAGYCLACQTNVYSDCEISVLIESQVFSPKILADMRLKIGKINPGSGKYLANISTPINSDKARLKINLKGYSGKNPLLSREAFKKIHTFEKKQKIIVTVTFTGEKPEIINFEPDNLRKKNYGLAIDLGTTTVVALIVNLSNGKILAQTSGLNKQITYGEALVSRISYGGDPKGLRNLQVTAAQSINDLIEKLIADLNLKVEEITDTCLGGNTVMNHLLAGLDPSYLAFVKGNDQVSRKPIIRKAHDLGIKVNPESYVYCLPNVSRFLGGDAIGDVLASGMYESEDLSLLVDMGTNGEIIIGNNTWYMSTSCASGPAFEGAGIRFGMRAMQGAIEHVQIDPKTCEAIFEVIGDSLPRGICGSGIIDAAAEMFAAGILDFTGKIVKERTSLVRKGKYGLEYLLSPSKNNLIERDIVITQQDLEYLLDSKAATLAAIIVLMRKFRLSVYDFKNLFLAGAFGHYVKIESLTKFGVLPKFPTARKCSIGNGSITGAVNTLLSMEKRKIAEEISQKMFYADLLLDPMFSEAYSQSIYIPGPEDFFPK